MSFHDQTADVDTHANEAEEYDDRQHEQHQRLTRFVVIRAVEGPAETA